MRLDRYLFVVLLLFCGHFFVVLHRLVAQDETAVVCIEDVLAGFRQNVATAQTLRVQWRWRDQATDASRRWRLAVAESLERDADDTKLAPDEKKRLLDGAKQERQAGMRESGSDTLVVQQDCWTDRKNLQVRHPAGYGRDWYKTGVAAEWVKHVFLDDPLTPKSLATKFADYQITSCGEATNYQARLWNGSVSDGSHFVGAIHPSLEGMRAHAGWVLPPLVLPVFNWGTRHLIDELFSGKEDEYAVLGEVVVDGISTVLIERRYVSTGRPTFSLRGFVDLNRGCLPLRIEYFAGDMIEFRHILKMIDANERPYFSRTLTNVQIESFDGCYYPIRGLDEEYSADADYKEPGRRLAVHHSRDWVIDRVEVNRPMPREMFALEFPENTLVSDRVSDQILYAGDQEGHLRRVVSADMKRMKPASGWSNYGIWGFAFLAVTAIAFVVQQFRRKRGA